MPEKKSADIALIDAMMQIFGIAPVNMLGAYPDLKNKLACRLSLLQMSRRENLVVEPAVEKNRAES